jgi:hypothetical protein
MKTLFSIAILITFSVASFGQTTRTGSLIPKTAAGVTKTTPDTTVNTDTTYLYSGRSDANQWNISYSWTAIPSISGTTTSVTVVVPQGSNTGTFAAYGSGDWVNLITDATQATVIAPAQTSGTYPVHISGSTAVYGYLQLPKCQFKYVRLVVVTAGTQTSVYTGTYAFTAPFVTGL